ncbi:neprilysin-11 [Caerostris darwini]|uniref:Neprilysin-11 n=1 Tax=Caerostris darwini TaxID=1538125 RepID=A0AAV4QRT6_9ARAC|nr:neprilysin-11 [Caerostris darwini]
MILNSVDLSVDPCKDFYSYCCGGWERHHSIPADRSKYGAIEELQTKVLLQLKGKRYIRFQFETSDKFGNSESAIFSIFFTDLLESEESDGVAVQNAFRFYKSCMNTSSIESRGALPFLQFATEWGGWPVVDTSWSAKKFQPLSAIAKIQIKTGYGYILPIIVGTDPKNTTRKLLQKMSPLEKMENFDFWYNNMTIKELRKRVPQIDWLNFIQEFTNSSLLSIGKGYEIHKNDVVIVRDIPYVEKISRFLRDETNARQISTYLGWRVLMGLMQHLPQNFTVAVKEFFRDTGFAQQTSERLRTCINRINSVFEMAAAFLYVKKHFSFEVRNEVRKLVLDLSFEFENLLLNNDWMDRKTKNAALEKLRAMKVNVGFPDWITDENNLDDYYLQTSMPAMGDNVFENDIKLTEYKTGLVIKSLRVPPKKEEWPVSPITINAAYNRNLNSITFPAAFLQLPLYSSSMPKFVNYAAIGSIIGHEITHGFDSEVAQNCHDVVPMPIEKYCLETNTFNSS